MTAIRWSNFGGLVPKLGKRVLPDNNAQVAVNCKLFSGELRAWGAPVARHTFDTDVVDFAHLLYQGQEKWVGFDKRTDVVRAPLVNDAFGRVYLTNADGAFITTFDDLANGVAPVALGLQVPTFAITPTIKTDGGTDNLTEQRVYVVVFVTRFGEESPASDPITGSGAADGTWTIQDLDSIQTPTVGEAPVSLRLYRTVQGSSGITYRQVIEWDLADVPQTYNDDVDNTTVAGAPAIESVGWSAPPAGMKGLRSCAGGFLAGFKDRSIYFSVPYYPHAWPAEYQLAVDDEVVSLGVVSNTIIVGTRGRAVIMAGDTPGAISLQKADQVLACAGPDAMTANAGAVIYVSDEGVVGVDASGVNLISQAYVTREEWAAFSPAQQQVVWAQQRLIGILPDGSGYAMGFDDPVTGLTQLDLGAVSSVRISEVTGQVMLLIGRTVYEFDAPGQPPLDYQWKSKPATTNGPLNFSVLQVRGTFDGGASCTVKLYGDGVLRATRTIASEDPVRLPSGYKASRWEMEITGNAPIWSVVVAVAEADLDQLP